MQAAPDQVRRDSPPLRILPEKAHLLHVRKLSSTGLSPLGFLRSRPRTKHKQHIQPSSGRSRTLKSLAHGSCFITSTERGTSRCLPDACSPQGDQLPVSHARDPCNFSITYISGNVRFSLPKICNNGNTTSHPLIIFVCAEFESYNASELPCPFRMLSSHC